MTHMPKVLYDECKKPEKRMIGGVCFNLGLFAAHAHGRCSVENYKFPCKPFEKYLKQLRKESMV